MFGKEQQRPTRNEFEAAALRLCENNYPSRIESSLAVYTLARLGCMFTFDHAPERRTSMLRSDRKAIMLEQIHEGYVMGEEKLEVFAKNQLARYRALH